jgi:DNA mismatch repair protein MutS
MVDPEALNVIKFDRTPTSVPAPSGARKANPSMTFHSIIFQHREDQPDHDVRAAPPFFADLNCDRIVDEITAGREEYDLKPLFHGCLRRVDAISYRQAVMRDLEHPSLLGSVKTFSAQMREMRAHLGQLAKMYYKEQQQAWILDAVDIYCLALNAFVNDLSAFDLRSQGFIALRQYLISYVQSARFGALEVATSKLRADLATVKYCVLIKGSSLTVRKFEAETDYSETVERTFEKFKQGAVTDYRVSFRSGDEMNHIEAKILEFVAKFYPDIFGALDSYCKQNAQFQAPGIVAFDREVQFYIAYLDYIANLKQIGLKFCYPRVSDKSKEVFDTESFDLALAQKLAKQKSVVVGNDFHLKGKERILVVSGPNQGGKTTFARSFGQLHYLASLGLPVPGRAARLFLFDHLLTHFEKEEKVENLRGKLEDDLVRIHEIINQATPRSIIIMNEVFTSTTLKDEIFLSGKVMDKIIGLDLLCVWVTFVDELASFSRQTVSMVSTVVPENPALRTFKVLRRPADGLAYAMAIAQKYGLTYEAIRGRLAS